MGKLICGYFKLPRDQWVPDAQMIVCGTATLLDFSFADTFFTSDMVTDATRISLLNSRFAKNIAQVIGNLLTSSVLQSVTNCLTDYLALLKGEFTDKPLSPPLLLPFFNSAVSNVLLFLCNLLTYTHELSTKLRKHIAIECTFLQQVILPYIDFLLDLLCIVPNDANATTTTSIAQYARSLSYTLKTLGFVTFKINYLRPYFRAHNFTPRLLVVCSRTNVLNPNLLAMIVRLNINIDYYEDTMTQHREEISDSIRFAYNKFTPKERSRVGKHLNNPPLDVMYPIETSTNSYTQLQFAFAIVTDELPPSAESANSSVKTAPFTFAGDHKSSTSMHKPHKAINKKHGNRSYASKRASDRQRSSQVRRWVLLKQEGTSEPHTTPVSSASTSDADNNQQPRKCGTAEDDTPNVLTRTINVGQQSSAYFSDSEDDEEKENATTERAEDDANSSSDNSESGVQVEPVTSSDLSYATITRHYNVPPEYLCSWTKQLMTVPVLSPYGDVFEKPLIIERLNTHPTCPITGKELHPTDLVDDPTLAQKIQEFQFRSFFRK
jgi:hypothetical protein